MEATAILPFANRKTLNGFFGAEARAQTMRTGSQVWNGARDLGRRAWSGTRDLVAQGWDGAKNLTSKVWDGANWVYEGGKDLASKAWDGVKNFTGKVWDGAKWVYKAGKAGKLLNRRPEPLARVDEPGEQIGKLKSYKTDADVPAHYRNDPRFKDLASDPDHGGAISSATRAEAMAGLEAESQGLIPGPIKRGPHETEFYAQGRPWDVKAPPSPSLGQLNLNHSK
jgi:hypothetical protein